MTFSFFCKEVTTVTLSLGSMVLSLFLVFTCIVPSKVWRVQQVMYWQKLHIYKCILVLKKLLVSFACL